MQNNKPHNKHITNVATEQSPELVNKWPVVPLVWTLCSNSRKN